MPAGERGRGRKRFSQWLCPNPSPSTRSSGAVLVKWVWESGRAASPSCIHINTHTLLLSPTRAHTHAHTNAHAQSLNRSPQCVQLHGQGFSESDGDWCRSSPRWSHTHGVCLLCLSPRCRWRRRWRRWLRGTARTEQGVRENRKRRKRGQSGWDAQRKTENWKCLSGKWKITDLTTLSHTHFINLVNFGYTCGHIYFFCFDWYIV